MCYITALFLLYCYWLPFVFIFFPALRSDRFITLIGLLARKLFLSEKEKELRRQEKKKAKQASSKKKWILQSEYKSSRTGHTQRKTMTDYVVDLPWLFRVSFVSSIFLPPFFRWHTVMPLLLFNLCETFVQLLHRNEIHPFWILLSTANSIQMTDSFR